MRLAPDDYYARVQLATILKYCGRSADSVEEADRLSAVAQKGFRNMQDFRRDPDLDLLRGTPEFEELMQSLNRG